MFKKITLTDFTGGMVEEVRADLLKDNQCQIIDNCEVDINGKLSRRKDVRFVGEITALEGDIVQGYLWTSYYKKTGIASEELYLIITVQDENRVYNLYLINPINLNHELINSFSSLPKLAITDKKVYVVDGHSNHYMYYFEINKDGSLEKGDYNVEQPTMLLEVTDRVLSPDSEAERGTLLPFGALLQYCYTFEDDEGSESQHSPVTTYTKNQFLFKAPYSAETDPVTEPEPYINLLKSIALRDLESATGKRIKFINIYRRHAIYSESAEGFTNFYLVKRIKAEISSTVDQSPQSEVPLDDADYMIKGDDVLFVDNVLFVSNGVKDLNFIGEYIQKITLDNTSILNSINPIISILLPDHSNPMVEVLTNPESRSKARLFDMDRQTPLKTCFATNEDGQSFLFVQIPYLYANTQQTIYFLKDCNLPSGWDALEYGEIQTDYQTWITALAPENLVKDQNCIQCIGYDSWDGLPTKVDRPKIYEFTTQDTEYVFYIKELETPYYIPAKQLTAIHSLSNNIEYNTSKCGYYRLQLNLTQDSTDQIYLAMQTLFDSFEGQMLLSLVYDSSSRNLILRRRLETDTHTPVTTDQIIYSFSSPQLYLGQYVQLLISWNIGPELDDMSIDLMFNFVSTSYDLNDKATSFLVFNFIPFPSRARVATTKYQICPGAKLINFYLSKSEFIDDFKIANDLLNYSGLAGSGYIGAQKDDKDDWININISFDGPDENLVQKRGLLYFTNEKMQFPPLNYVATRNEISRIMASPMNMDNDNYNSVIIFSENSIDRLIVKKDFDGVILNKNIIAELYNYYLKYPNMIEPINDSLYWIAEQGIVRYNQNGIKNLTEDIINISKFPSYITSASFIQYLPDKQQVFFYLNQNYCLAYDLQREVFFKFKFSSDLRKGFFRDYNIFFGLWVNNQLQTPTFSPDGGTYDFDQPLTIEIQSGTPDPAFLTGKMIYNHPDQEFSKDSAYIRSKSFINHSKLKKIETTAIFDRMTVVSKNKKDSKTIELFYNAQSDRYELPQGVKGDLTIQIENPETVENIDLYFKGGD